jgi:amino acid adenylation domain-containing protein
LAGLLQRLGCGDDLVIGTIASRRPDPRLDGCIGHFVRAVPLRTTLRPDPRLLDLVQQAAATDLAALGNADIGFDQIVAKVNPARSPRHPLIQVAVASEYEANEVAGQSLFGLVLEGTSCRPVHVDAPRARFDLSLLASEQYSVAGRPEGISLVLEHALSVVSPADADRWAGALAAIFNALADDPRQELSSVDLFDAQQRELVAAGLNSDSAKPPDPKTVPELFTRIVDQMPDMIAVDDGERCWTYREIDDWSNAIAWQLLDAGVAPGNVVGNALPRSASNIATVLGISKCGAAWLPIDPHYPVERIRLMVDALGPAPVVATAPLQGVTHRMIRPTDSLSPERPTDRDRGRHTHLDDLAYVIFTSGSTGVPKAVGTPHRGLSAVIGAFGKAIRIQPGERQLHQASTSFDMAVVEVLVALFHGGTCVVARPGIAWAGRELSREVAERRIDHLLASPTALRGMVEGDLAALRSVVAGGEVLHPDLVAAHAGRRLAINAYGPTEVTICCTMTDDLVPGHTVPIGRAIAGDRLHILDAHLAPVLPSVAGELYISAPHLVRGYIGHPGLTAARFIADPWADGTRMYRSGDVVRYDASGVVTFIGRSDSQVKVRGFRIELGEIENHIACRSDIDSVHVFVREDQKGDPQIAACLIPAEGQVVDPREVRDALRAELPHYMIPATVQAVDFFPMTPNGKVDIAALPAPMPDVRGAEGPRSPIESVLVSVFSQVLGCDAPGVDEDFFTIGGHSLLATRVAAQATAMLGVEVGLRDLFEAPTAAGLAELLVERAGDGRPKLLPRPAGQRAVPSPAQQRLLTQGLIDGPSPLYNVPLVIDFSPSLDATALAAAVDDIVARHEALRSRIVLVDGEASVDFGSPQTSPRLVRTVCATQEAADEEVERLADAPFDLTADYLLRATLVMAPSGTSTLVLTMHHIVCDGISAGILLSDLAAAYGARLHGAPPDFAPLPIQFGDTGPWLRSVLGQGPGSREESQLKWWANALRDAPEECIPTPDRPRPAVSSRTAGRVEIAVSAQVRQELFTVGRRLGASLHMILAATVALTVARMGGGYDVMLGTVASGRARPEVASIVGFFVNTLAARFVIKPDWTFEDLVGEVRQKELDMWARQDVPFDRVVEELSPRRHLARHPLFQVMFALDPEDVVRLPEFEGTMAVRRKVGTSNAKFDLSVLLEDMGEEGIRGVIEYSSDLYDRSAAERFASSLQNLLAGASAAPAARLRNLRLDDQGAADAVARGVGPCGEHLDGEVTPCTLDSLFRHSALAHAERIAVEFGDERWTYRDLDAAAEDLFGRLVSAGVQRGDIVGLMMPRGPLAVAGMLAITRSGAAWLPLDPDYPPDRLTAMIQDAKPAVILTVSNILRPDIGTCISGDDPSTTPQTVKSARTASLDDAAYVIFTSGSSGRPKGVVITHRGLVDMNHSWTARSGVGVGDRQLQNASMSFDAAIVETLQALANGATLCVPQDGSLAGEELGRFIDQSNITHAILPPSTADGLAIPGASALRCMAFGGEMIDPQAVAGLPPTVSVLNAYGPTEATVATTMSARVSPDDTPIGRPLGRTPHLVLDTHLAAAPVGVPGELYVSGVGLARGYLNRPGATAHAFVAYPYGDGERMYRTGDIVAWREDGELDFRGRSDAQVKVRGFRIELGEVEAALREHPAVAAARVVVQGRGVADRRLDAYVVLRGEIGLGVLRDFAASRLPAHAVPSTVTGIPELPLTPNGKLDLARLPTPEMASAPAGRPPRNQREHKALAVFTEILGQPGLTIDDSFFEFGGHSLLAARVANRLQCEFGEDVTVRDIFEYPTVASLCARSIPPDDATASSSRSAIRRPTLTRRPS